MHDQPYATMLRMALDGALNGVIMGPNCRTRSVLRHYPVSSSDHGPRPLRKWGGEEFGRVDLTKEEKKKVVEDDTLLWRGFFLYVVSVHVRRTFDKEMAKVLLGVEQPASPDYMPETVSLWRTQEWKMMERIYDLHTQTFNQGDWLGTMGGGVVKPTTMGGTLKLESPEERNPEAKGRGEKKGDLKKLSRWVPGLMRSVARAVIEGTQPDRKLKVFSWEEHIQNGHVPFHRDCAICQQAGAKSAPHRRIVGGKKGGKPKAGVLSLDTSGPFTPGKDVGEEEMRFILVGAFTWAVKRGSKLKEDEDQDECPEEAPVIEIEAEEEKEDEIQDEEERNKPKRGRPRKPRPEEEEEAEETEENEEERLRGEGDRAGEERLDEEGGEEVLDEEEMKNFEVKTFRMVVPMPSKRGDVVLQCIVEMVHQLRIDGFEITQVHSDNGGEFTATCVRRWLRNRGYIQTFTGVNEPQANGRAENAVQQVKNQMRRLLLQAGMGPEWWPVAARHTNAQLHALRLGKKQDFPPLNMEVFTKKRKEFAPTMEKVRYLCPSWQNHGHWVMREDGTRIITRFYLAKVFNPVTDQAWIAVASEQLDPVEVRRRLRGKTTVRMCIPDEDEMEKEVEESEDEEEKNRRPRVMRMIAEEMMMMMMEDGREDQLRATMRGVVMLRSFVETGIGEDVLQTRIVGINEVLEALEDWKAPVIEELTSLIQDKQALKIVTKSEAKEMFRRAFEEGRKVEVVPGKLVTTVKPGPAGGKKKARIVACGNFTTKDSQEELYAGTGDAVTLRYLLKRAVEEDWEGMTIDVKAAFLNTPWDDSEVLVKPPSILTRMKLVEEGTLWQPTRALYGFRKSPRLWGHHRDGVLRGKEIQLHCVVYVLRQLVAEPNLWKIEEREDGGERIEVQGGTLHGVVMVYVDDIFAAARMELLQKVIQAIQEEWETSTPTPLFVSSVPVRFLGMEIVKEINYDLWS